MYGLFFSIFVSDCTETSSNYTLLLNISSNVLAQDNEVYHILENKNVILTAYSKNNSSNLTDFIKQSSFYFKFQYRYVTVEKNGNWSTIKCLEDKNNSATVNRSWDFGGRIQLVVELLTKENKTLACKWTEIQIAGIPLNRRCCILIISP